MDRVWQRPFERLGILTLGVTANLLLFVLPLLLVAGPASLSDAWLFGYLLLVTLFCVAELTCRPADDPPPVTSDLGAMALHQWTLASGALLLIGLISGAIEHALLRRDTPTWLAATGAALMLAGIGLRMAAMFTLREQFRSTLTGGRPVALVQSGLYRWVRHPSETGLLLLSLGACALSASVVGLVFWAMLVALSMKRCQIEDAHLAQSFGDAFERYRAATGAIIPWRSTRPGELTAR